jgi:hypothetical protein
MDTILRMYFNPADKLFPRQYKGQDFFEIANPVYIPKTGDKVYFEAATFINDTGISDKIEELMDYDGFKVKVWRVDYQSTRTVISGSLTSTENFED